MHLLVNLIISSIEVIEKKLKVVRQKDYVWKSKGIKITGEKLVSMCPLFIEF